MICIWLGKIVVKTHNVNNLIYKHKSTIKLARTLKSCAHHSVHAHTLAFKALSDVSAFVQYNFSKIPVNS